MKVNKINQRAHLKLEAYRIWKICNKKASDCILENMPTMDHCVEVDLAKLSPLYHKMTSGGHISHIFSHITYKTRWEYALYD